MGWQDISILSGVVAKNTVNLLISCQPMLKLTTQYGFYEFFRF